MTTNLYTLAMLSIGLGNSRLLRASALASAVLLVACGGGDDKAVGAGDQVTTTTVASPTTVATTATPATTTTTASLTTGNRSPVSTTIAPTTADAMVTDTLLVEKTNSADVRPLSIDGVGYVNALQMYSGPSPGKVEINAGRSRKRFLGTLGIPDDQRSTSSHQVEISLDNAAPALSVIVNFGESKPIDLDVTGVLRVRITVSSKTNTSGTVAIGNPRFT